MSFLGFTESESLPYLLLLVLTLYILISNYVKGARTLWSPITIVLMVFSYYCLLGPYQSVTSGKTFDRLMDMRQFYTSAFWGALVSVLACLAGFHLNSSPGRKMQLVVPDELLSFYGKRVCIIGFLLFTISTGGSVAKLLNPFNAEAVEQTGGSLSNYFSLSINFLVPGVGLLFAYYLKTKKGLIWLLVAGAVALGLYITLGFRWRIVLLVLSSAIVYFLLTNKKPNLVLAVVGVFLFISAMGIMDKTRRYGKGLQLELLETKTSQSNYESGLNEAKIFQTSGAIIDYTPSRIPYAGFTPIISTLLFPIPRAIYQSKNSADYVFNAIDKVYGKKLSRGAAFLMYAEHYLAFGWIGVVGGGFLIGWFLRKLWMWYLANWQNPLVVVTYAVTVSFLYVLISRGYLPQATMLFFFTVFPAYVVIWQVRKRVSMARRPTVRHAY